MRPTRSRFWATMRSHTELPSARAPGMIGGIPMGRLADRLGVMVPLLIGGTALGVGYIAAAQATSLWQLVAAHGLLIAFFGCSATFGPMIADVSHWFDRRRGIAVAIIA